jgi:hypothetical protein
MIDSKSVKGEYHNALATRLIINVQIVYVAYHG